jgi:hypothetical protein
MRGGFLNMKLVLDFIAALQFYIRQACEMKGGAWILVPETEQFCGLPFPCRK